MTKVRWTLCGALVACAGLVAALVAALSLTTVVEAQAPGQVTGGKAKKLESKSEMAHCASTINFAKDLGLSFPSLTTLGARIEQARDQADPVSLALDARELAVAEKVSGKQAAIKSQELLKEATELAKVRYNPAELKAVALLTGKSGAELVVVAEKAEKDQIDAIKARESGEKTRGIQGRLHVDSRVPNTGIRVFVDGRHVGTMGPMGDLYPWIGQTPWETTYLSARSFDGRTWHRAVRGAQGDFTWTLYP